jgi:hypothetical protein
MNTFVNVHTCARAVVLSLSLCAGLMVTSEALAAEHTHDGFYMQIDSGLGYYHMSADQAGADVSFSGVTSASQFLIGGTPVPGFVIGGGIVTDYVFSPKMKVRDVEFSNGLTSQYVFGVGPFVDIYPDPNKGLHFQGLIGFGGVESSFDGNTSGNDPTGLLLSIGAGYDWWVAREWSIGVMGRLIYAPLKYQDVSFTTTAPAIMATFTYH